MIKGLECMDDFFKQNDFNFDWEGNKYKFFPVIFVFSFSVKQS